MSQRSLDDKIRVHVWLNKSDLARIAVAFPRQKQSEVIRTLVNKTLDALEAQAGRRRKIPPIGDDVIPEDSE